MPIANGNGIHYRVRSGVWSTPQDFFDTLNAEFHFTLDACAITENAKCDHYFSPEQDGLAQPWTGVVWCNPPFGNVTPWLQKAVRSTQAGTLVVCLLPSRTGTRWFRSYVLPHAEIRYVAKRLRFNQADRARFDVFVAIFRPPMCQ